MGKMFPDLEEPGLGVGLALGSCQPKPRPWQHLLEGRGPEPSVKSSGLQLRAGVEPHWGLTVSDSIL